jgi:hypothetical protein
VYKEIDGGTGAYADVTHTSTPSTTRPPWPPAGPRSSGGRAASSPSAGSGVAMRRSALRVEKCRTGVDEKNEDGVWDWCIDIGVKDDGEGGVWRISICMVLCTYSALVFVCSCCRATSDMEH